MARTRIFQRSQTLGPVQCTGRALLSPFTSCRIALACLALNDSRRYSRAGTRLPDMKQGLACRWQRVITARAVQDVESGYRALLSPSRHSLHVRITFASCARNRVPLKPSASHVMLCRGEDSLREG